MKFRIYQAQRPTEAGEALELFRDLGFYWSADQVKENTLRVLAEFGLWTHVSDIMCDDLSNVFGIGNIGPEENITRHAPMRSLSVGDVVVDPNGTGWLCVGTGWAELFETTTTMVTG